jgi:hypothetical protein
MNQHGDRHGPDDACCDDRRLLNGLSDDDVSAHHAAMRAAGFRLLVRGGVPVRRDAWAHEAGLDDASLAKALRAAIERGRVEMDDDGRLVGIAGLTVAPTRHRIDFDDVTRWTWCALDAVGILAALGADGVVSSTDPLTGDAIEIVFDAGLPQSDSFLFIASGYNASKVMESWCPLVNFFSSADAARSWASESGVDGDIVPIALVSGEAAELWAPVVGH